MSFRMIHATGFSVRSESGCGLMRNLAILSRRSILSGFADQAALEQIRLFLETGVQVPEVSNGDPSSRLHETFC
jgi:hypothetical protein